MLFRSRVTKVATGRPDFVTETALPVWTYLAAERAADFAAGAATATISVVQTGAFAVSRAATISVPTN